MPDTCSKCSISLDADAVFCPSCATPVNPQCPSCKKPIIADAKFCKYCAFDLTQKGENPEMKKVSKYTVKADIIVAEKYEAMSDAQLIAALKDDLSQQTEQALSIILEELRTRKDINSTVKSFFEERIKEFILSIGSPKPLRNNTNNNYPNPSEHNTYNTNAEESKKFINYGAIAAGISALVFLWGYNYTNSFENYARAGFTNLIGQTDPTFRMAQVAVFLGAIGFIAGAISVFWGFSKRS